MLVGMATSFSLICAGLVAAFQYVLKSPEEILYLSPFITFLFIFSCFCGGMVAGYIGGVQCCLRAGQVGLIFSFAALFFLKLMGNSAVDLLETFSFLFLSAFVSIVGALGGANLGVRRLKRKESGLCRKEGRIG